MDPFPVSGMSADGAYPLSTILGVPVSVTPPPPPGPPGSPGVPYAPPYGPQSGFPMQGQIRNPLGAAWPDRPRENSPTLSPNQLGRYGPTEALNFFQLLGTTVATTGWDSIYVDRPTILRPATQLSGRVHYHPHRVPIASGQFDPEYYSMLAAGPGIVYLWAPGTWWVKYHASGGYARFLRIPCEDPALAAMLMSEPGFMDRTQSTVALPATTATDVLAVNNWRRGLILTVANSASAPVVTLSYDTAALSAATPTNGIVLSGVGASVTLSGASAWRGAMNAYSTVAVALNWVEWT